MTPHEEYVLREKAAKEWRKIVSAKMAEVPFKMPKTEADTVAVDLFFNNRHDRRTR